MQRDDLDRCDAWFRGYIGTFPGGDGRDPLPYRVKERHTGLVRANSRALAAALGLDGPDELLAEAVALFHDVGRFPQYRRYGTFRDSESVNHAALSAQVLLEEKVLDGIDPGERRLVVHAVTMHNVFSLPAGLDERTLLHAKLIRDADKLDIWRYFVEQDDAAKGGRSEVMGLGLPDAPVCSPEVLACLRRGEMVSLGLLRTYNDFKLLQLSWVFDLNFPASFSLMTERGVIDGLAATLPQDDAVTGAVEAVREHVEKKRA